MQKEVDVTWGFYEKYLLPKLLNAAMKSPGMSSLRKKQIPLASGKVLEIGIGSGLNIPLYQKDVHVTGVDPSEELQTYARALAADADIDVEFIAKGAEDIPVADDSSIPPLLPGRYVPYRIR